MNRSIVIPAAAAVGAAAAATMIFAGPVLYYSAAALFSQPDLIPVWAVRFVSVSAAAALAAAGAYAVVVEPQNGRTSWTMNQGGSAYFMDAQRTLYPLLPAGPAPDAPDDVAEWVSKAVGRRPVPGSRPNGTDPFEDTSFLREKILARLQVQLGERWASLETVTPVAAGLAVMFALHMQRSEAYEAVRDSLAEAARMLPDGGPKMADLCRKIVSTHAPGGGEGLSASPLREWIDNVASKHAWTATAVMGLLRLCRSRGVLSSAEFIWLKSCDRPLFYALNAVGRPSFFVEAIGAAEHFGAELEAGAALEKPFLDGAVDSIAAAAGETGGDDNDCWG